MSTFQRDNFRWRETYFVLFEVARRPPLKKLETAIHRLSDRFVLADAVANEAGLFESLTVRAPDNYAALDISFVEGEEVVEQRAQIAQEMKTATLQPSDLDKLTRLKKCTARFDIMHFEEVSTDPADEGEEMLDPSALLIVLEALIAHSHGVGYDPQSGTLM